MREVLVITPPGVDCDLLCARLGERGYRVTAAPDGRRGVQAALHRPPDVILLDSSLPPMDRWHAVKRLSAEPTTSLIPVLTLSEVSSPAGLQRLLGKVDRAASHRIASLPPGTVLDLPPPPEPSAGAPPAARAQAAGPAAPLPARISVPPATVSMDPAPERARRPRSPLARGGARLLVVDDNALNRDMLSRRLVRRGYHVDVAEDGEQALDLIESRPYDLVLLDWMMPGLSGLEVLQKVRTQRSRMELPIIMATARSEAEDLVRALRHEANDYVTKPLNFDVVQARVRTQLELVETHRRLVASEQRYRALLENTGDLILQYTLAGNLTYVSPASRTLLGIEPEAMAARNFYEWMHPIDRRAIEAHQAASPALPPAFTFIARLQRQDDTWIWAEISCRLVRGAQPTIFAACRDVTEHMERVVGDEPPLPLAGDIMAHPGWRGQPTTDPGNRVTSGPPPRPSTGPTYTPPTGVLEPRAVPEASGERRPVVLVATLDGITANLVPEGDREAFIEALSKRLVKTLEPSDA